MPVAIATGAAVVSLCVAGVVGWLLGSSSATQYDVTVSGTFTGTVTLVSADGTEGCVKPVNGPKVCSIFATFGEHVRVGETVHVAHELYKNRDGNGYDLLLIVPATAPG